jgi:hypothetical protein
MVMRCETNLCNGRKTLNLSTTDNQRLRGYRWCLQAYRARNRSAVSETDRNAAIDTLDKLGLIGGEIDTPDELRRIDGDNPAIAPEQDRLAIGLSECRSVRSSHGAIQPPPDLRRRCGSSDALAPAAPDHTHRDEHHLRRVRDVVRRGVRDAHSRRPKGSASRDFSLRDEFGPSCWSSPPFEGKP